MVDFKKKFTTFLTFIPRVQLSKEEKTQIFEERIHPRYKDLGQMRLSFIEMVDIAMIVERNYLAMKREIQS